MTDMSDAMYRPERSSRLWIHPGSFRSTDVQSIARSVPSPSVREAFEGETQTENFATMLFKSTANRDNS